MKSRVCPACNEVFYGKECWRCGLVLNVDDEVRKIELQGESEKVPMPVVIVEAD